jgi:hypothetical protein
MNIEVTVDVGSSSTAQYLTAVLGVSGVVILQVCGDCKNLA